jgi:hypothetical protein
VELHGLEVGTYETDAGGNTKDLLLRLVLGSNDLEDGVEGNHKTAFGGLAIYGMVEDSFGGEDKHHWLRVIALEVEGCAEYGVGGEQFVVLLEEFALFSVVHATIIINIATVTHQLARHLTPKLHLLKQDLPDINLSVVLGLGNLV